MKKALVVYGGWDGHEPDSVGKRFAKILKDNHFEVELSDTLDSFNNKDELMKLDLIVPVWTMGTITDEQCSAVSEAVASGVGMAGCHGGMCDSFRESTTWQFITGGQWVAHPGGDGTEYTVNIKNSSSPLVEGINDFKVKSEQYYLHVDPAVEVLATTDFPTAKGYNSSNKKAAMPVCWTKRWGLGRVYYNSLGHHNDIFDIPEALELMTRGLLWAAEGKEYAIKNKLSVDAFID